MTRETAIGQLLINDTTLKSIGVERIYRSTAPENPEEKMFGVAVWGTESPGIPTYGPRSLVLWLYDTPGDYLRLDAALDYLKGRMLAITGDPVGQVEWVANSADLYDDVYKRSLRTGTYTVH